MLLGKKSRNSWGSESPTAANKPWTTGELDVIRKFRAEGVDAIYEMMRDPHTGRPTRTRKAIARAAERIGVSLAIRPGDTCPVCGVNPIRDGTNAARHDMCVPCWNLHLAELKREQAAMERTHRVYEAEKKRLKRARGGGADA